MVCVLRIILLFVLVELSTEAIFNGSFLNELDNGLNTTAKKFHLSARRQNQKTGRSTSSSSSSLGAKQRKKQAKSSLDLSEEISTSSTSVKKPVKNKKKDYKPRSSKERTGWKKWHRKCSQCQEDMHLKWRDPSIKWICGAYQTARRSFKSSCMMQYRNCQDGTMFVKIADHRCENSTPSINHGEHFFYDYTVKLSGDSSETSQTTDSMKTSSEATSSESWNSKQLHSAQSAMKNALNRGTDKTF